MLTKAAIRTWHKGRQTCSKLQRSCVGPPRTSSAVTWAAKLRERLATALAISCYFFWDAPGCRPIIVLLLASFQPFKGQSLYMMWTHYLSKRIRTLSVECQRVSAIVIKGILTDFNRIVQYNTIKRYEIQQGKEILGTLNRIQGCPKPWSRNQKNASNDPEHVLHIPGRPEVATRRVAGPSSIVHTPSS